jgi:hypothetical protein
MKELFSYFSFFQYPPSFDEVHLFYPEKITKKDLQKKLDRAVKQKKIAIHLFDKKQHYALNKNKNFFKVYEKRRAEAVKLLSSYRFKLYIQILSLLPWIEFVGISGSISMMNAKPGDDIDLFVVSSPYRMWTARLVSILFAEALGFRRRRHDKNMRGKVCLNLFFDGCDVEIPSHKRNSYIAHEIIQLWPVHNKQNTYQRFLRENEKWITSFFPNSQVPKGTPKRFPKPLFTSSMAENMARKLQTHFIDKHKTSEYITQTQLWFFPDDFEKKLGEKLS